MTYAKGAPFKNPFSHRATPEEIEIAARRAQVPSVQSSLHFKLRATYPINSGQVAWTLVWAVSPRHKRYGVALASVRSLATEERAGLRASVQELLDRHSKEKPEVWVSMMGEILGVLS